MKKMNVTIEKQQDGTYIAYNTEESDFSLMGTGCSVSEAKSDFFNSMEEVKLSMQERGVKIPALLTNDPEFKFDLASLFEYYSMLNVSAFARFIGINDALMRQYKKGNTYISDVQLKKIESGIHTLGKEFASLKLV